MLLEKIQECTDVQLITVLVVIAVMSPLLYNVSYLWFCFNYCLTNYFSVAPEIILPLTDLLENETNNIQFVCQAIGVPVPYIMWYFNGVMVNLSDSSKYINSSMYQNESIIESILNIINAESSDVGRYTCEAKNIIGSIRSSGVLTVNGMFCTCIYTYVPIIHTYMCTYRHVCMPRLAFTLAIRVTWFSKVFKSRSHIVRFHTVWWSKELAIFIH